MNWPSYRSSNIIKHVIVISFPNIGENSELAQRFYNVSFFINTLLPSIGWCKDTYPTMGSVSGFPQGMADKIPGLFHFFPVKTIVKNKHFSIVAIKQGVAIVNKPVHEM